MFDLSIYSKRKSLTLLEAAYLANRENPVWPPNSPPSPEVLTTLTALQAALGVTGNPELPVKELQGALGLLGLSLPFARADKPLRVDERESLLRIIRALADLARLDLNEPSKAAGILAARMAGKLAMPSERTVDRHLKAARDLLD